VSCRTTPPSCGYSVCDSSGKRIRKADQQQTGDDRRNEPNALKDEILKDEIENHPDDERL
jgi:hypothetical protein